MTVGAWVRLPVEVVGLLRVFWIKALSEMLAALSTFPAGAGWGE